jgi:hypothetical protein
MKHKIIGIIICTILISCSTTLALTPFSKDEQQRKHQFFNTTPVPLPAPKTWIKTFGGIDLSIVGWSVQQTSDGGYIITGSKENFSAGSSHLLLIMIKTDSNGNKVWDKTTFRGTGFDSGNSVQQTSDGGYIITGSAELSDGGLNVLLLIKTDSQGSSKSILSGNLWFERLFQRFPNAFPILRKIMGY